MAQSGTGYLRPKRLLSHLWPGVLAVFGVHAAAAQSPPLPSPPPQQLPAYCAASKLTGNEFLQAIQKIIAHGDLTDIGFLEKTLGTKFSSSHGLSEKGTPDSQFLILDSEQTLKNPISVNVIIFYAKSDQLRFHQIAGIAFGDKSNFIADCFHLSPADLSSYFGGGFYRYIPPPGSPIATYYQRTSSPGKGGSKISISFRYGIEDSSVHSIGVGQFP